MNNNFKISVKTLDETDKIGFAVAQACRNSGGLICLYGNIGAGKTTLTKSIAKYLDITEKVTSPSFVILNEYHTGVIPVYHFDLYRLEEEGLKTIIDEIHEYTEDEKSLALVEWAEFDSGELPQDRLELKIEYTENDGRDFRFTATGKNSLKKLESIENGLKSRI
jgi:tRNA threonylcarbamoyladenosine biosynthesis protein TsaE